MKIRKLLLQTWLLLVIGIIRWTQAAGAQVPSKPASDSRDGGPAPATDWTQVQPEIPKGKIENFTLADKTYHRNRKISVYTPPNYSSAAKELYRLLICFDGSSYLSDIPAPAILDNLLAAGKIEPTVAVMIDNSEARLGDLANHAAFADFVGKELVPWIRSNWRVATEADKTILANATAVFLAVRGEEGGTVLALDALGDMMRHLNAISYAFMVGAASLDLMRIRAVPRWMGWFGMASVPLFLIGAAGFPGTRWEILNASAFPFLPLWPLLFSIALLRRFRKNQLVQENAI